MRNLIAFALAGALALVLAAPAAARTERCPDGGVKTEAVGSELNGVVLEAGTEFCVKGSTDATGVLVADGTTDLATYLGNGHDVSHYVVYATPEGDDTPEPDETPVPSTELTPDPTPGGSAEPIEVQAPIERPTPTLPPTDTEVTQAPASGNWIVLLMLAGSALAGFGATLARARR